MPEIETPEKGTEARPPVTDDDAEVAEARKLQLSALALSSQPRPDSQLSALDYPTPPQSR